MRSTPSSYAARSMQEISRDFKQRDRLSRARQERQDAVLGAMSAETLELCRIYQQAKARAAAKGKPVLLTIEEWRGMV